MDYTPVQIWLTFGVLLVVSEAILPGLVAIFVGLGAATVGILLYQNLITSVTEQLITFFISTTIYLSTLRILILKLYPSDTKKSNIDEVKESVGRTAIVTEEITREKSGRIEYEESTWPARTQSNETIPVGACVKILNRDNITWLVENISSDKES